MRWYLHAGSQRDLCNLYNTGGHIDCATYRYELASRSWVAFPFWWYYISILFAHFYGIFPISITCNTAVCIVATINICCIEVWGDAIKSRKNVQIIRRTKIHKSLLGQKSNIVLPSWLPAKYSNSHSFCLLHQHADAQKIVGTPYGALSKKRT